MQWWSDRSVRVEYVLDSKCKYSRQMSSSKYGVRLWFAPVVIFAWFVAMGPSTVFGSDQLPEANANVLERLEALRPNHAIVLGNAVVTGDLNEVARQFNLHRTGPQGRDYSIKMVWAHDQRRALFAGANHGLPHRLNDVWAFDLAAMSWILLYGPDNPRSYAGLGKDARDVQFQDGVLVTRRGGPAIIAHTWWGLTYDPTVRRMLFMNTWVTDQGKAISTLGGNPDMRYKGPPLWSFDPVSRRWQLLKTARPWPRSPFGGLLEYVPALGGAIWHANNWQMRASWLYDASTNTWRDLTANAESGDFASQAPAPEQVGYHDPHRGLIVVQSKRNTYHFDIALRQWRKVVSAADDAAHVPFGHDARTPFYFDPSSGKGLLIDFRANALWAYDPDSHTWARLEPEGDPMPDGKKRLAYLDPERNVFVVLKDTKVWAYRYRGR